MAKTDVPSHIPTKWPHTVPVRLDDETMRKLDRVSGGKGQRSRWIRDLIEKELTKYEDE